MAENPEWVMIHTLTKMGTWYADKAANPSSVSIPRISMGLMETVDRWSEENHIWYAFNTS
jgi:hypothetical protein